MEFCNEKELTNQTGHEPDEWPLVIVKELVDNSLDGALRHADSMGTGSVIRPGEVQRMTAGTGVLHSEHNDSASEPVHLLQIWIVPEAKGLTPGYEQRAIEPARAAWTLLASRDGRDGSVFAR